VTNSSSIAFERNHAPDRALEGIDFGDGVVDDRDRRAEIWAKVLRKRVEEVPEHVLRLAAVDKEDDRNGLVVLVNDHDSG
jgi:hypothetical protein